MASSGIEQDSAESKVELANLKVEEKKDAAYIPIHEYHPHAINPSKIVLVQNKVPRTHHRTTEQHSRQINSIFIIEPTSRGKGSS